MAVAVRRGGLALVLVIIILACSSCQTIKPPRNAVRQQVVMETTGYCKCGQCCNWKRNWLLRPVIAAGPSKGQPKKVGQTASGRKAKAHRTIAADTSRYPFGTVMYVPGWGYGVVEDRGSAVKGDHIDLFFGSHGEALRWGRRKKQVTVWTPR